MAVAVLRPLARGEGVLPALLPFGRRLLTCEGVGEVYATEPLAQFRLVQGTRALQLSPEGLDERGRQHVDAVFAAFAVAHGELEAGEV
jgi:hypothetical protein